MQDPYFQLVWYAYIGSGIVLTALVWWQVRNIFPCWLKAIFITWGIALLFTPTFGNEAGEYWVPALMAVIFNIVQPGGEIVFPLNYAKSIGVVWATLAAIWLIICIILSRRRA